MLLAFSGRAGSGKDTAAQALKEFYFVNTAFAEALKEACQFKFNLSYNDVNTQEGKQRFIPEWNMTVREILQIEGTEGTKPTWGEDFWWRRWLMTYNQLKKDGIVNVSVTDVRFNIEAENILDLGGRVILIKRDSSTATVSHSSEHGISPELISHTIYNNGSIEDLHQQVIDYYLRQKEK